MPSQSFTRSTAVARMTPVASCIAVAGFVAGLLACSSTVTGTGSDAGTFGGGSSGRTSGGTSGGSSSTVGGGTTTVPASCSASAGDTACTACLKLSCCSQTKQCASQPECDAVFSCAAACTTQQCTDDCVAAHPSAQTALSAFISCEEQFCMPQCNGTSGSTSGSSGGTSGSSGSAGSCTLASDQSVCAGETGRTKAEDCPSGPPTSQCFQAPGTGISNVYCCPP